LEQTDRFTAFGSGRDLASALAEVLDEQVADVWFIVHNEYGEPSRAQLWHSTCCIGVGRYSSRMEIGTFRLALNRHVTEDPWV